MEDKLPYLNCLVLLQTLEVYWAYYSISDGKIYSDACRKSANAFSSVLKELVAKDPQIFDSDALGLDEDIDPKEVIQRLLKWGKDGNIAPFDNMYISIRKMSSYFKALKAYILKQSGATADPIMQENREELMYREGVVRWQAHFPTMIVMGIESPEELLKKASAEQSIVVVGEIKNHQDLMTYTKDFDAYTSYVVQFIEHTRMLVDEYMGVFDKFTGHGFIAYFNKAICDIINLDVVDCFTNFVRDETVFANDLFNNWSKSVRKLPPDPMGLAMGADIGRVEFLDLANHLVSVGEPTNWALRLANSGKAGEVVVNNLLHEALESRADITGEDRMGQTQSGEDFIAKALSFI
jgi:hypothetical protein